LILPDSSPDSPLDADLPPLPLDAAGRRPAFFSQDGVDQLLTMVLELATELWVLRERVFVIEAAAADHGLPLKTAVETYALSAEQSAELARIRGAMMDQLFRSLHQDNRPVGAATVLSERSLKR
jgi:hypothetical protein